MKEIKARIEFLKAEIVRHNELYYLKDDPEISDIEYDALVKELEKLEKENPHLFRQDSPSSKVSGGRSSTFAPISHLAPMLSLDNTYSESEIEKWYERILKTLASGKAECIVEPKVDGASVNLRYENSILTSAATRGDGGTGEDITENIKTVSDIPQTLSNAAASGLSIEIRGEIYIGKQDFEELNERVLRESGQKFANARNAAAGSLRQKNPQITAGRRLKFFAHSLGASDFDFKTQFDFLKFCQQCGFRLQKDIKICRTLKEIIDFSAEMLVKRDELQYEIDGLVIKTNLIESQKELGNTNKSPRWAVSYKFPAKQVSTKILKIRVQVGRTGALTPVAVLEPVSLSGVTISNATLHNFEEIERLNVNEGDIVLIERAGDVIPKIVKVSKKINDGFFKPPQFCPSCRSKIAKENEGETAYRCINPECPEQFRQHLLHFVSRNAMDIDGLGPAAIDQLLARGKLKTLADIYSLKLEDLLELELFQEKKASKLLEAIEASKKNSLSRLLSALGIRHIGEKAAEIIAEKFKNIDAVFNADISDLTEIDEIGGVLAVSIKDFFERKETKNIFSSLIKAGVNMSEIDKRGAGSIFSGKTFVLTGELDSYTRAQASEIIKAQGGKTSSSVSGSTDFVLAGKEPGSKLQKAQSLGVKIIDEKEFKRLINERN